MSEPPFDDTDAYARGSDPDTSHIAADKIKRTNSETMVYNALRDTGVPMTSLCITRYLQATHGRPGDSFSWSVSPRLAPLEAKGWIERCGRKAVLNSNGNIAYLTAWRIRKPRGLTNYTLAIRSPRPNLPT